MLLLVGQEVLEPRHQYQGLLLPMPVAVVVLVTLVLVVRAVLVAAVRVDVT